METRELRRLNHDATPALERLIAEKIRRIIRKAKSSGDGDALEPLADELRYLREAKDTESTRSRLCYLMKRANDFEEMFLKYNVPRIAEFGSFAAVESFMEVWRAEAKRRRGNGEKTLIEWTRQLDREKRTTFDDMRLVMIDLGNHISINIVDYFMLVAVSVDRESLEKRIEEVEAVLRRLKVEENSVVINVFVSVVGYVRKVLNLCCHGSVVRGFGSAESDVLRLIFREVLRFEIAFGFPDLPMMLIDEVFLGMANHLRDVFGKKLERVKSELGNMAAELEDSIREEKHDEVTDVKEMLDFGVMMIWAKLDLKSQENLVIVE